MHRSPKLSTVLSLAATFLLASACDSPGDVEDRVLDIEDEATEQVQDETDEDAPGTSPSANLPSDELATAQDDDADTSWWGGASNCKGLDRYPEHGVYESTLVYFVDETLPPGNPGPFTDMEAQRNTVGYRTFAYDFFEERYGMAFDPNDPAPQLIFDGQGGQALVQPTKTGDLGTSTHQVYAIDSQYVPQWRHKIPVTNVAFLDDGYFVFILEDFVAHGTYGGDDGLRIRAGDLLVAGEYRMFDHKDRLLDTIEYVAQTPATVNPFNGDEEASEGATFVNITCNTHSDIFGDGLVRGLGEIRPLADGSLDLDFRYVMRFPSRVADSDVYGARCKKVKPLWW